MIDCERHPAERAPAGPVVAAAGCCCCCCCVHTVGALIGAATATKYAPTWGRAWWSLVGLACVIGAAYSDQPGEIALGIALGLPFLMLGASLLLGVGIVVDGDQRRAGLREVGWLATYTLGGGLVGMAAMWLLFGVFG